MSRLGIVKKNRNKNPRSAASSVKHGYRRLLFLAMLVARETKVRGCGGEKQAIKDLYVWLTYFQKTFLTQQQRSLGRSLCLFYQKLST